MELEGKVAMVTGAAQGIGADTARRFAAEGARVVAVDLQEEKPAGIEKEGGEGVFGVKADMGDTEGIDRAFEEAVERFGGVDILVNCAVIRASGPLDSLEEEIADLTISVGLKGYIFCAQRAAREMRKRGGGAIVNMSSFYVRTPALERALYVTIKGGVESLTRALAVELAEDGIRVNAIAAGPILTERRREEGDGEPGKIAYRYQNGPMGRFGRVEEITDAMLYLVTPKSSYMTGQVIVLDGGLTIV